MKPLLKSIFYPAIVLALHGLVEHWGPLVHALGPHYAFLASPTVVGVGLVILHQMESPTAK